MQPSVAGNAQQAVPKNPKSANIVQVENGFIVNTQKVNGYGQTAHIATSIEEAADIIKTYFSSEE